MQTSRFGGKTGPSGLTILFFLLAQTGCSSLPTGGEFTLSRAPAPGRGFENVVVSEIGVGVTTDSLDSAAPAILRNAIIEVMKDTDRYGAVVPDTASVSVGVRVDCEIVDFETGSRVGRYLVGRFGGEAHLDADCQFFDLETGSAYAEGQFTGKVSGGLFGGAANVERMSKDLAAAVTRFLLSSAGVRSPNPQDRQ